MSESKHGEKLISKSHHKSKRESKQAEKMRQKDDKKSQRSSIISQNQNESSSAEKKDEIEVGELVPDLKVEIQVGKKNLASRMISVFKDQKFGKPVELKNVIMPSVKNPDSILTQYLFKENTTKEDKNALSKTQQNSKKKKSNMTLMKEHFMREDEKYNEIRDQREMKRNYISTISARCNPDIIVPSQDNQESNKAKSFMRGNEYFMEKPKKESNVVRKIQQSPTKISEKEVGEISETEDGQISSSVPSFDGKIVGMVKDKPKAKAKDVDDDSEESDFDLAKKGGKGQRYWAAENITIKCHNCKQFGHMAKECPNETKRLTCILCGKDTHESFDCNEKMCFKCNKVGHQARECTETNIVRCQKCNHIGHREARCLKESTKPTQNKIKFFRCIECGKSGHIKCSKESKSDQIKIDSKVMNDLNEFILEKFREAVLSDSDVEEKESKRNSKNSSKVSAKEEVDAFDYVKDNKKKKKKKSNKLTKQQKKQRQQFINESTNVLMPSSEESFDSDSDYYSEDSYYEEGEQLSRQIFGKSPQEKHEKEKQIYCAFCAGKHSEQECPNKSYSKSQQFNNIRENFAKSTNFKQVGENYSIFQNQNQNNQRFQQWRDKNPQDQRFNEQKQFRSQGYQQNFVQQQIPQHAVHQQRYVNQGFSQLSNPTQQKPPHYTSWGQVAKASTIQPAGMMMQAANLKVQKTLHQQQVPNQYDYRADMDLRYFNNSNTGSTSYNKNSRGSHQSGGNHFL